VLGVGGPPPEWTVDCSGEAVVIASLDGVIASWNPAARRVYGYAVEETLGRSIAMLNQPGHEDYLEQANAAAAGRTSRFETGYLTRDGRHVDLEVTLAPIRDRADAVIGTWCAARDITERKHAEHELARMVEAAEYGTDSVVSIDLEGYVRHWDRGSEQLYGVSAEEAIGKRLDDLNALTGEPEEANARWREAIVRVLRGEPAYRLEARRRRRDGVTVDLLMTIAPWHIDKRVAGVTATVVDITQRARVEQASARLAAIVESSDDAIIGKTLDGQITSWNAAAEHIYGYSAAEAVGKHISMLLAPGQEEELSELLARAARGERVSHLETTRRRKDGRIIDMSITTSPIRDRQGRIVGAATVARDVTERKQHERELERLAQATEYSTDAIVSWDRELRICHWSAGAERMYGFSAVEVLGLTLSELYALTDESTKLDARIEAALARVLAGETLQLETSRLRKDYSTVDARVTLTPWRRDGQIVGMTTVSVDITERNARERELARLAQAAEHGTDAVLSIDLGGRVQHWNHGAEKLYGYSAQEAIGRNLRELTLLDSVDQHIDRVRGGASPYQYEAERRRKDGTIIDILTTVVPWHVDAQLVGVTGVTIDITERKRAEQTAARLAAIVESTDDAIVTYSPEGVIETWNAGAERLSGYTAQEVIGQRREMLAGEGWARRPFDDVLAGGTARYESRAKRRDGSMFDTGVTMSPIRGADGTIVGVSCIWQDITERKQIERNLRQNQATLEAALSSMTDAVFISDAQGQFVHLNEAFTTFHRFTSREQTLSSLEDYPAILEVFMASGEPAPLEQWAVPRALRGEVGTNVEYGLRRRDTGERWVGSYSFAPIRSADGTIVGSVVAGRDITGWKNAQAELEQAQRLARLGSWTWNPSAGQVTWSAQMYELFERDAALGPAIGDALLCYVHPEDRQRVRERYELGARSGPEFELDFRILTEQGEERALHAIGREGPSRPGCYLGTFQDVTNQRRAEQERIELLQATARGEEARRLNAELEQRVAVRTADLKRVNRELETFAYSVSHDLRAPLRAVDGFSEALLEDYGAQLDEEGRHYLERVRAGAVRMGDLIDEILELSRLSRRRLEPVPIDLSALAHEVLGELTRGEPERGVQVEVEDGVVAEADLALVQTVLQNLLSNACKFTSKTERPCIRFGKVEQHGVPVYFVADNGAGFDMAHAGRLFRPFHRLHRESEFPGDGIGLATVMRAVHRHGGVVWAEGGVNQGARFHFSLAPGAHPPAAAATGEDAIPSWQPTEGGEGR
jgi:PAS domain S-box-containing protein